jgi:hypothetical protein
MRQNAFNGIFLDTLEILTIEITEIVIRKFTDSSA